MGTSAAAAAFITKYYTVSVPVNDTMIE